MSEINSYDEWSQLREVIVGIATNAKYPKNDLGMNANIAFDEKRLPKTDVDVPNIPEYIIEETNQDLELFVSELKKLEVRVKRPKPVDTSEVIKTSCWETTQYFNYCPRDILLVIGDMIIESPCVYRSRCYETLSYREILLDYMKSGSRWIAAPRPRLRDDDYITTQKCPTVLSDSDPIFDAANIIRAGRDIFFLISNSGNELGYEWLKNLLGDEYRVHPLRSVYSGTHIDTTIAFLRPGLILANPERVNVENLPAILKKWDIVYAPKMREIKYSDLPQLSSAWLGMNLFMINPNLAVVDADQIELIKLLERRQINVLPLRLRHGRLLEGGFHCVTLDINREGEKEDYFN